VNPRPTVFSLRPWIKFANPICSTDPGGGGCIWEAGADPKTAKCTSMNPTDENYNGLAQPPQSPAYIDQPHTDRSIIKYGPKITYLFDLTQPRWEERTKQSGKVAAAFDA
jgi:hypothetical protein